MLQRIMEDIKSRNRVLESPFFCTPGEWLGKDSHRKKSQAERGALDGLTSGILTEFFGQLEPEESAKEQKKQAPYRMRDVAIFWCRCKSIM